MTTVLGATWRESSAALNGRGAAAGGCRLIEKPGYKVLVFPLVGELGFTAFVPHFSLFTVLPPRQLNELSALITILSKKTPEFNLLGVTSFKNSFFSGL
jgi:hypothetical protein